MNNASTAESELREPTATRPKRRWWRVVLLVAGAVALLIATALSWLVLADHQYLHDDAENLLSNVLGRTVEIDGPMHLSIGREIEISVSQLRVAATDWSANSDLLQLESLTATVDSLSLLSDEITVETLSVNGLHIFLQQNPAGENNWTIGAADKKEAPLPDAARPTIPLKIHDLAVNSSRISYTAATDAESLVLQIASLSERIDADGRVDFELHGDINDTPLRVSASTGDIDKLNALRDVAFNLDASLGEVQLTSEIAIEDLLNPTRPRALLSLTGPNVEYLTDILQFDRITTGPLQLTLKVVPDNSQMNFDLDGTLGEFVVHSTGTFDNLQLLQDAVFDITASGPDAGRVSTLLGVNGMPETPFDVRGSIQKSGANVRLEDARLTVGSAELDASANFENFPGVEGATASLQLHGPGIEEFSELTGMNREVDGPFAVDLALSAQADATADIEITASAAGSELRATGNVTDNSGIRGSRFDLQLSTPDLSRFSALTGIAGLPALPLNVQAALQREEASTTIDSAVVDLSGDVMSLDGTVGDDPLLEGTVLDIDLQLADTLQTLHRFGIDVSGISTAPLEVGGQVSAANRNLLLEHINAAYGDAEMRIDGSVSDLTARPVANLQFSASGPNLASLLSSSERDLTTTFQLSTDIDLGATSVSLDAIDLRFDRTSFSGNLVFDRDSPLANYEAALEGSSTDITALVSAFTDVKASQRVPMNFKLQGNGKNGALQLDALTLNVGEAVLQAAGNIAEPPDYTGTELQLDLEVPDMSYVAELTGASLPAERMTMSLLLESVAEGLVVDDLKVQLGDSVVNGDVSFRNADTPHLEVNLSADLLDLSAYIEENDETAETAVMPEGNGDGRLIPDTPVPIEKLSGLDANIRLAVSKLVVHQRTQTDLQVNASIRDGGLEVDTFRITGEYGGNLWGRLGMRPVADGAELGMRLFGENIEIGLPAETEEEQRALPRYDLKLAFITRGQTIREMAGAANGYLKIVSGEGVLRTGKMNVFTQDFLFELLQTINPFLKSDPYTKLKCTAILASVEDGQLVGNPVLVAQSERLKILAKTHINLKTEVVDADINTVAQKGIGISLNDLVNPYVKVGGTLKSPALRFDQGSALIEGGAAVATGGISILAKNLAGRFLGASDPCARAVTDAEEVFEKLEEKYSGTAVNAGPAQLQP